MGIISGRVFAGKQAGPVGLEPAPGAGSVRFVLRAERIVQVIITDHPGRAGYGPLKNNMSSITAADEIEK